jgi:hypothetical protein
MEFLRTRILLQRLLFTFACIALILLFSGSTPLFWAADKLPNALHKPPIPRLGAYLGAILLEGQPPMYQFNRDCGFHHALFMEFLKFPDVLNGQGGDHTKIISFVNLCKASGAMPVLTLETSAGLNSYTSEQISQFAVWLKEFDVPIFLRWNHEMNGSWYPWGQQPTLYISKYVEFAETIHAEANNVVMVWTPNQGWGYPWVSGQYAIKPDSPDFPLLDTNKDGRLTEEDDPYGPYYPGDNAVDWVGFSFYHWGNSGNGYNEIPFDGKWGLINGIDNPIPNFHDIFAKGHNKPMMIAETSALYDPNNVKGGGASEADIKIEWIKQVYNLSDPGSASLTVNFPMIKAICWFSQLKYEQEVNGQVDWRINSIQEVSSYYATITATHLFHKAIFRADSLTILSAPTTVQPGQQYVVKIKYSATTKRDIILNLLDSTSYGWHGGGQVTVEAGSGMVSLNITVLPDTPGGAEYFWDVLIVPDGGDWTNALDREQMNVSVISDAS